MSTHREGGWLGHGVLLLHAEPGAVVRWAGKGTLPVYVVPGERWTAAVPAGPARTRVPYDHGASVLAARPVPARRRPAIGLWTADERAVVSVHLPGRSPSRWVVWTPGAGPDRVGALPVARSVDLVAAAGLVGSEAVGGISALLRDSGGTASSLLHDLATALDLPCAAAVDGAAGSSFEGARLVQPSASAVARFNRVVGEDRQLRAELEEGL
ncbi:hypothetical protein MM440_04625 [Arsenicicoccus piscis]|uniref:hypothetical protein n=1 Tax=Arsenicicoccus piscis TaxID=673954 RepID=UPI001F4C8F28|nr:hypothetical protein [Arsenicicoccus piscis]MCH8627085.1 hypothetical protein [Arsenicicoccus piscis]